MTVDVWNEPTGGIPRGTLILLPGRGETRATYARFGARMGADAYRVRLAPVDLDEIEDTRVLVEKFIADESLPSPKVLVGTDSGATLAGLLIDEVAADAAVIAGAALPDSYEVDTWEAAVDARTACPVHRKVIGADPAFGRGALSEPLPWDAIDPMTSEKPMLILHGTADPITAVGSARAVYAGGPHARFRLVHGGRHDVLNDVSHRSVAATIVLFLESLRIGADLPDVVGASLIGRDV